MLTDLWQVRKERAMAKIRVFRVKLWRRVMAVFFALAGVLFLIEAGWALQLEQGRAQWMALLSAVFFVLFGLGWMAHTFQNSVAMGADWVELRTWRKRQRLSFDKIKGKRESLDKDDPGAPKVHGIRLEAEGGELASLEFERFYEFDRGFWEWYRGLRDLDAEEESGQSAGAVAVRG